LAYISFAVIGKAIHWAYLLSYSSVCSLSNDFGGLRFYKSTRQSKTVSFHLITLNYLQYDWHILPLVWVSKD